MKEEQMVNNYKEMYAESCSESGEKPSASGLKRFSDWRMRVEKLFEENPRRYNHTLKFKGKYSTIPIKKYEYICDNCDDSFLSYIPMKGELATVIHYEEYHTYNLVMCDECSNARFL